MATGKGKGGGGSGGGKPLVIDLSPAAVSSVTRAVAAGFAAAIKSPPVVAALRGGGGGGPGGPGAGGGAGGGALPGGSPPPIIGPSPVLDSIGRARAKAFAAAQADAYHAAGVMSNLGFGGMGAATGRAAGFGKGLSDMGMTGMGTAVSRMAPGIGMAVSGLNAAAKIATTMQNPYLTDSQRARAIFRDVVPFGESVQKWHDAFTGREAALMRVEERHQVLGRWQELEGEREHFRISTMPELAGSRALAMQYEGGRALRLGVMDRSTAGGEVEYRMASRLLPVKTALAKAAKEEAAANEAKLEAETRYKDLVAKEANARHELEQAEKGVRKDLSGPWRKVAVDRRDLAIQAMDDVIREREQAAGVFRSTHGREAEASLASARARSQVLQTEAENLESRAAIAGGGARRLGSMGPADRALGLAMAKSLSKVSDAQYANYPPELKQYFEQFAPEEAAKKAERAGATTREFKGGQAAGFAGDFGGVGDIGEELRRQAGAKRDEARGEEYAAESGRAQVVAQALDRYTTAIEKLIDAKTAEVERKVNQGFIQQNNGH